MKFISPGDAESNLSKNSCCHALPSTRGPAVGSSNCRLSSGKAASTSARVPSTWTAARHHRGPDAASSGANCCGSGVAACTIGGLREDAREVVGFAADNLLREEAGGEVGGCIIAEDGLHREPAYGEVGGSLGADCGLDEVHDEFGGSLVASCWLHEGVHGELGGNFGANEGLREGLRGEVGGGTDVMRRRAPPSLQLSWHGVPVPLVQGAETSVHAEPEVIPC